jgi:PKD domain
MRRPVLVAALALVAAALSAGPALAAPANFTFMQGPVMSGYRTVEVVWTHGTTSPETAFSDGIGSMLGDIGAASGTTGNLFSMLAQYSTSGLPGGGSVISAYRSQYQGRFEIAPVTSGNTVTFAQIQDVLNGEIEAGRLPAPVLDANGGPETIYVLVTPPNLAVCDPQKNCGGAQASSPMFCSNHSNGAYNSVPYTFDAILELSGGLEGSCGTALTRVNNETASLSHQLAETITDPFVSEERLGWYDLSNGEIADICVAANGQGTSSINGHSWTVQKIWSNLDQACVTSTSAFGPPSVDFTAVPTANTAAFSAAGKSTNHLAGTVQNHLATIAPGIASYSWDFGDGQSGAGATPSHAYAAAGAYTVNLTATDALGFTAHASHEVTVAAPPPTGGPGGSGGTPKASVSTTGGASTSSVGGAILVKSGETASCPAAGGLCVIKIEAEVETAHLASAGHGSKNRRFKIGAATITLAAGASAKLTFKLNAAGKKLLRTHSHIKVKLRVTILHGSEPPNISTHRITLRAPKKHGR